VNGQAIYGTRPWTISGEGPTENLDEHIQFNEYKFNGYVAEDIRFTAKGDYIYILALDNPSNTVLVNSLSLAAKNGKVESVELLGSTEKVTWTQKEKALQIQPSKMYPTGSAVAYKVLVKK